MSGSDTPVIRLVAREDLADALALSTTVGWNQQLDDWQMLVRLAPAGSFAALHDGHIIGTAIGIDYGGFAWIAMMLVNPAYRGRGVGRCLLEAAISAVPSHLPIRLDATPLGRALYQRCGFEDEAMLTRHVASVSKSGEDSPGVRRLTADDLRAVAEQDRAVFGGDRTKVLEWALASAPHYGHVVQDNSGLAHYSVGRPGRLFDQIGPVVAGNVESAQALVNAALTAAGGRPVVVDAFDSQSAFTTWLRACGFESQRPLFRMRRPAQREASENGGQNRPAQVEFAILGPEFG